MAPPIRYTPESIQIAWKDLNDSQIRSRGMRLSQSACKILFHTVLTATPCSDAFPPPPPGIGFAPVYSLEVPDQTPSV